MLGKTHRIGKSLISLQRTFASEEECLAAVEAARWPDGVRCLKCDGDKLVKTVTNETTRKRFSKKLGKEVEVSVPRRHLYRCLNPECNHQFSAIVGTVFNDTHLSLTKWFLAMGIMLNAKKGASAKQIERDLGVSYKTAWYLCHRIRKAMDEGIGSLMTGTVEADETYIGGKYDKRRKRQRWDKTPVFGIVERGYRIHTCHVDEVNRSNIYGEIKENVAPGSAMMTDESQLYKSLAKHGFKHEVVNHSEKEYVRGDVHTNSIDGFWSLFKRGLIGSFHQVSIKHLQRYLNEFEYRYNNRQNEELFALTLINLVIQSGIRYKQLTAKDSATSLSEPSDEPF